MWKLCDTQAFFFRIGLDIETWPQKMAPDKTVFLFSWMHPATNSGADKSRDVIRKIECRMQYRRGVCELRVGGGGWKIGMRTCARHCGSSQYLKKKKIKKYIHKKSSKEDIEVKT